MEAINRLERAGLTVAEIAEGIRVGPPAVRRWKRGECAPNSRTRKRLVDYAAQRGLLLLATDFNVNRAEAA